MQFCLAHIAPDRRRSGALLAADGCGSGIACFLLFVSGGLWSAFVDGGGVFDCRLSGLHMYKHTCLCVILDTF